MYAKFLNLPTEKQIRIINASLFEFSEKGFERASTNEIVQAANISKGLIFHYFKSKKGLFLFLYDYCVDVLMKDFYNRVNMDEKDFFQRVRNITIIKMELLNKYPEIFKFMQVAYMESAPEVKGELADKNKKLTQFNINKIFDDIDTSKFKDEFDIDKVKNIVFYTFQGITNNIFEKAKLQKIKYIDYEKAFDEADGYIEILKNCLYK